MRRTSRLPGGRTCAVLALASFLLVPWPGAAGRVTGQQWPTPVGAVAPRLRHLGAASGPSARSRLDAPTSIAPLVAVASGMRGARAAPRGRRRDPFLAGVLGAIAPGLGHVYAGRPWTGAALFVLGEGGMLLALRSEDRTAGAVGGAIGFTTYVFSIMDAPRAAAQYNARHERHEPPVVQ